jgi:hypothetical protein
VSTALMYSFAERPDTRVVDEPLYGHYLRVTGARHPGREEVLANMECDGDKAMRDLLVPSAGSPGILFVKQMAHHLVDVDKAFLAQVENVFLVRDPQQMLPSLIIQVPDAAVADTGLKTQWELYDELASAGQSPAVIDSRELLLDPPSVLRQLCEHLDIPFLETMLSWAAGPRSEDGVWARHWYDAVHKSTGFSPYRHKQEFPERLEPLLADCAPWYEKLYARAIRAAKNS